NGICARERRVRIFEDSRAAYSALGEGPFPVVCVSHEERSPELLSKRIAVVTAELWGSVAGVSRQIRTLEHGNELLPLALPWRREEHPARQRRIEAVERVQTILLVVRQRWLFLVGVPDHTVGVCPGASFKHRCPDVLATARQPLVEGS